MAFEGEDARRWSMTDAPTLQPAVDFITKSPNGPFIDTGFDVSFEQRGRMYLSVDTIKEMAEVAGLLENKKAQELSLHELEIENRGYERGLRDSEELVGKLTSIISRMSAPDYSAVISDVETVEDIKGSAADESGKPAGDPVDVQAAPVRKRK
jgi:hypothetical protein